MVQSGSMIGITEGTVRQNSERKCNYEKEKGVKSGWCFVFVFQDSLTRLSKEPYITFSVRTTSPTTVCRYSSGTLQAHGKKQLADITYFRNIFIFTKSTDTYQNWQNIWPLFLCLQEQLITAELVLGLWLHLRTSLQEDRWPASCLFPSGSPHVPGAFRQGEKNYGANQKSKDRRDNM